MSKEKQDEGETPKPAGAGVAATPVDAEPVAGSRAASAKADPEAEDAAVIAETPPGEARERQASHASEDDDLDDVAHRHDESGDGETAPSRGAGGGGLGGMLWAAAGALVGGALVLFAGEAMRPATPPVSEIATKDAVEARLSAEIRRLAGELNTRLDAAQGKTDGFGERLALLDDRDQRGDEAARSERAAQEADIAKLQDELATERTRIGRLYDELAARERERAAAVVAIREQVAALAAAVAATPGGEIGDASTNAEGDGAASSAASATRLALLEGGLRRLEARVNGLSAEALPTPDLTRIDKLESAARTETKAREALGARLDAVERAARSAATGGAALGVAFAALSDAISSAEPYQDSLTLVTQLAPPGAVIAEPLVASAEQGLPSYGALTDWLETGAWEALDAAAKARLRSGEAGVIDRLSNLFTFRPHVAPGEEADTDAALLDRARRRMEARDAAGALEQADKLSPAAKAALADWRKELTRRATAEQALASLKAQLLGGDAPDAQASEAGR